MKKLSPNLIKITSILNDGAYHDGTSLGEALGLTRSAIWKIIKKLQTYDIHIDSIKGKGYAFLEPVILLSANKIAKKISEKIDITVFESVASTNDYLKSLKPDKKIKACLAEQQTKGKGRLNREWYSPFGRNIYLSLLYPFQKDVSELSGLSMVTSLAIVNTLKEFGINKDMYVKWPNDIIYANKKISGSLIEIQAETHGSSRAIIGIGINVNMLNDKEEQISQAWSSMQKVLGVYIDRNELATALLNNLLDYLNRFERQGFLAFMNEWMQMDCLTNQFIAVKNLNQKSEGTVTGINEQGHLLLKLADGRVRAFSSGDTTIVKK